MSARLRRTCAAGLVAACLGATLAGPSSAGARTPADFFGVVSQTALSGSDLQRMQTAGVGSLRFTMLWSNIQGYSQGSYTYNWGPTDALVTAAAEAGVPLHPVLMGTPKFAAGCDARDCQIRLPVGSAQGRDAWSAFVRAVVARYKPGGTFWQDPLHILIPRSPITTWQIWNEENNTHVHASPSQYAKLVELARAAMSSQDSSAQLILGGLAGNITKGHEHRSAWGYLGSLYRHASKSSFNAVALHPYTESAAGVRPQVQRMRKVMTQNGDSATPLDITEIGWGSDRSHVDHAFVETKAGQKRRLQQAFQLLRARRTKWNIGAINWFAWKDPPPGAGLCGFCYSSGLLDSQNRAKPSYSAFVRFTGGS